MTNLEAIRANISDAHGVVLTQNHFMKALADAGLTPDAIYASEAAVDRATIKLYDIILGGASLSEGHLSYNFTESVEKAKKALEGKLGMDEDKNDTVSSVKFW